MIRQNAERGFKAVSFTEAPHQLGLPTIHSGYWDPFLRACAETETVVNLHIGSSGASPSTSEDAPPDVVGVLFFGLVRQYKGVEDLLAAFRDLPDEGASLRVVGYPEDAALGRSVTEQAAADSRIGVRLECVDDETLAAEISAAQVVVLPYRHLHNSGAALLALNFPEAGPREVQVLMYAALALLAITLVVNVIGEAIMTLGTRRGAAR